MFEIVGGKVNLSRIRNVSIEDLLRREPVELEMEAVASRSPRAGRPGHRGRRQHRLGAVPPDAHSFSPANLLLLEQAENSLFNIASRGDLRSSSPHLARCIVPAWPTCAMRTEWTTMFRQHRPEIVFHAAAHKHVP